MRVLVTSEFRFLQGPDGGFWTPTMFPHAFWRRYLEVFDGVRILARAAATDEPPAGSRRVDGPGVDFAPLPHYLGPLQYLRRRRRLRRAARAAVPDDAAVILRVGSQIADLVLPMLARQGRPYGLEVVGDPWDVFAPGASTHPLRPLFRRWFAHRLRRQCAGAAATAYVTERTLQERYPPAPGRFTTHYSSIVMPDEAYAPEPRSFGNSGAPRRLVAVGTLAQMYKGFDTLIEAAAILARRGDPVDLVIVGDGRHRKDLEGLARHLRVSDRVDFTGQLAAGSAVREQLDRADLFLLPSRQEGLPRAMIEAMARGLPCLGTRVGGIPELLPPDCLVPPGDAAALAERIGALLADPARLAGLSARNLDVAGRYREEALAGRRREFYAHLRGETERWLRGRAAAGGRR